MIKLENTGSLPQARALLTIQSLGDSPAISLFAEDINAKVGDAWQIDVANKRQKIVTFVEGDAFELGGKVSHLDAVECHGAYKVVVEVEVETMLTQAYAKGDRSKEIAVVSLVRVVEVWATVTKKLWSYDAAIGNGAPNGSKSLDPATGKIVAGAAR